MNMSKTSNISSIQYLCKMENTNHTRHCDRRSTKWLVLALACIIQLLPIRVNAQIVPRDIPTIEAYIYDHKQQRSLLLARSTLEESNKLLHQVSKATHREYRDVNVELDKYTKAFDVIDLVYSTVSTGFNVYRTYDTVSDKIGKYKSLLSDFNDKIVRRGRFETADTLLLAVNVRAVRNLANECQNLYSSVMVLAAYASGKVHCTTASMMLMVENINKSLDRIKSIVNTAYFQTWKFIKARTSYWKSELYRSKTIREVATDALGRWMEAGRLDY